MQPDLTPSDFELFSFTIRKGTGYTLGDPINAKDPSGLDNFTLGNAGTTYLAGYGNSCPDGQNSVGLISGDGCLDTTTIVENSIISSLGGLSDPGLSGAVYDSISYFTATGTAPNNPDPSDPTGQPPGGTDDGGDPGNTDGSNGASQPDPQPPASSTQPNPQPSAPQPSQPSLPSVPNTNCSAYLPGSLLQQICSNTPNGPVSNLMRGCLQSLYVPGVGYIPILPVVPSLQMGPPIWQSPIFEDHAYCWLVPFIGP